MMNSKVRLFFWAILSALGAIVIAGFVWVRLLHHHPPAGIMKDLQAGIAARQIKDPDERFRKYLEQRYGPLSDPANRQKAFLGFFNTDHIRALQVLVKHSPPDQRQANIKATADWIAEYRATLSPQERADLVAQIQSDAGRAMLKQAMGLYNSQDVYYRGSTVPVISQLLTTLHGLEKPQ